MKIVFESCTFLRNRNELDLRNTAVKFNEDAGNMLTICCKFYFTQSNRKSHTLHIIHIKRNFRERQTLSIQLVVIYVHIT